MRRCVLAKRHFGAKEPNTLKPTSLTKNLQTEKKVLCVGVVSKTVERNCKRIDPKWAEPLNWIGDLPFGFEVFTQVWLVFFSNLRWGCSLTFRDIIFRSSFNQHCPLKSRARALRPSCPPFNGPGALSFEWCGKACTGLLWRPMPHSTLLLNTEAHPSHLGRLAHRVTWSDLAREKASMSFTILTAVLAALKDLLVLCNCTKLTRAWRRQNAEIKIPCFENKMTQ